MVKFGTGDSLACLSPRLDPPVPDVLDAAFAVGMAGFEALGTARGVEVDGPPLGVPTTDDTDGPVLLPREITGRILLQALVVRLPRPGVLPAGDASGPPDESTPV